jgi:PAS domain S-box-containing protein
MNDTKLMTVVRLIVWLDEHPALRWLIAGVWVCWSYFLRTMVPQNQQADAFFAFPSVMLGAFAGFVPSLSASLADYAVGWNNHISWIITGINLLWILLLSAIGGLLNFTLKTNHGLMKDIRRHSRELQSRVEAEVATHRIREEQFRVLINGVRDYAIIMLDVDGRVATWNLGAERIKGWAANEIIGQHFAMLYPVDRRLNGGPDEALRIARTEGEYRETGIRVRRDGTSFVAEVLITALRNEDGSLRGYAKITRDISETAQQERTAAVGLLAQGMAHDINNVLQVITVSASMIEDAPGDMDMVHRCAARMTLAATRGAAIARRLLDFSRRDRFHNDGFDVQKIFDSIQEMIGPLMPVNIKIEAQSDPDLPLIMADPSQLETVLVNLATNARDAMPNGGKITMHAMLAEPVIPELRKGQYIKLIVRDNGHGMDAETLSRVTEPYFTTKSRGHGTGLGLPMAKNYAEQAGGRFEIDSIMGEYTEVILWLPTLPQTAETGDEMASITEPPSKGHTIMVVDDDDLVRETVAVSLRRRGMVATEMCDGESALTALKDKNLRIDVLVVDYGLPGMSGLGVAREANKLCKDLPVLLITGNIGDIKLEPNTQIKALRKPFTPAQLIDAVNELLPNNVG